MKRSTVREERRKKRRTDTHSKLLNLPRCTHKACLKRWRIFCACLHYCIVGAHCNSISINTDLAQTAEHDIRRALHLNFTLFYFPRFQTHSSYEPMWNRAKTFWISRKSSDCIKLFGLTFRNLSCLPFELDFSVLSSHFEFSSFSPLRYGFVQFESGIAQRLHQKHNRVFISMFTESLTNSGYRFSPWQFGNQTAHWPFPTFCGNNVDTV